VALGDDRVVTRDALVTTTRLHARAAFLADLGLATVTQERDGVVVGDAVPADPTGATAVPGVWVAGNVAAPFAQVVAAAAGGATAGAAINADLVAEEARRAVVTRRAFARSVPAEGESVEEFWDGRYAEAGQVWSGEPNQALVREVEGLAPGTALDLGCGEGGDAVWLARRGWRVTADDVSAVALARGEAQAAAAGVGDRVTWQRHDLAATFPEGTYDLVTSHFLHSPGLDREAVLRRAVDAVAPGGTLLAVGHLDHPRAGHHHDHDHPPIDFTTPDELLARLDLPPDEWDVVRRDAHERTQHVVGGETIRRTDGTLRLRRRLTCRHLPA
jgi:SAM-dependent methyltransferase